MAQDEMLLFRGRNRRGCGYARTRCPYGRPLKGVYKMTITNNYHGGGCQHSIGSTLHNGGGDLIG